MSSICRHCFRKIGVLVERRQPVINHDRRSLENRAMLWGDRLVWWGYPQQQNPTATG
jgi:hypothetical protein